MIYAIRLLRKSPVFAVVAVLTLALGNGADAIISYSVSLRTSEIGIRMALGADTLAVLSLVVGQGLRLILIANVVGLIVARMASRAIASLLFETNANDPLTFVAVSVLFAAVGTAAAYLPTPRAMRVDPLTALRAESQ